MRATDERLVTRLRSLRAEHAGRRGMGALRLQPLVRLLALRVASRAADAERTGRIGDALALYAEAGDQPALRACIRDRLPEWAQAPFQGFGATLDALSRQIGTAQSATVPASETDNLIDSMRRSAVTVWRTADQLVAATSYKGVDPVKLRRELTPQVERLWQIVESSREAGRTLETLTLKVIAVRHGGSEETDRATKDLRRASQRLTNMATALEDLQDPFRD